MTARIIIESIVPIGKFIKPTIAAAMPNGVTQSCRCWRHTHTICQAPQL
jgi:hypothetical protein